jgi:transcription initiation factor TFIIH subunit 2
MFARSSRSFFRTRGGLSLSFSPRINQPSQRSFRPFSTSIKMSSSFERLIRFETADGKTVYGNLEKETPTREIEGTEVEVLSGDVKSGFSKSGERVKVNKLLCPLKKEDVNIILCVGLNYRRHAEECNVSQIPARHSSFASPALPTTPTFPSD